MLCLIHRGNLLQLFSLHAMNQEVSPCYHICLPVTLSYHRKETPFKALHAEKIAEVFLLSVFRIALEDTARYAGLLLALAEDFGLLSRTFFALRAKKSLLFCFCQF